LTPRGVPPRHSALRSVALAAHTTLAATLAWLTLTAGTSAMTRAVMCVAAVVPLVATLPGLAGGRRTVERWLALLLVVYVGAATVEVVATSGRAALASIALLAAVAELGLVLALIRRSPSRPRASGG
jgi:uncharacterized membrane protein